MFETKNITRMTATRRVTRARGAWKWVDPMGVVTYHPVLLPSGRIVWASSSNDVWKASPAQLSKWGYDKHPVGSLHNKPVKRSDAIEQMGARFVKWIEGQGYHF